MDKIDEYIQSILTALKLYQDKKQFFSEEQIHEATWILQKVDNLIWGDIIES